MENRFKVVYTGELQPYVSAQEAVHHVAALFKVNENGIRSLVLGGRPRDIKVNLDQTTAARYVGALSKAGLVVRIEPMVPAHTELRMAPLTVTEEATPTQDGGGRCPKCGASAVQAGVCGACGVVVAKYLARLAADSGTAPAGVAPGPAQGAGMPSNLYAPTRAELTPEVRRWEEETLTGPHALSAGHGWGWISRGFWHFKANPLAWILIMATYLLITIAVSLIPLVGALAVYLIMPIFTGGIMLGAQNQGQGGPLRFGHLFAGFTSRAGQLVAAGVFYLGGMVVAAIPAILLLGIPMLRGMSGMDTAAFDQDPQFLAGDMGALMQGRALLLAALVTALLVIPVAMAYWFAPVLIAIDHLSAWSAMKLSFRGCLKNIMPFLVYGVAGMVLILLGSLPVLLGLLVVLPTLTASMYTGYRDIFYGRF
jgi:uncharacterized membrane protein